MKKRGLNAQYTIILGAEGELGKAMAREVARKGCNLVLVSTTSIDLQRFAIGLQLKEEVQVDAVKLDLSDQEAVQSFTTRVRDRYEVRALINNITGYWSLLQDKYGSGFSRDEFMTRFRSAALVTWSLLPQMSNLSSAFIQHIIPFPFQKEPFTPDMQLSAGKMVAFARELEEELKHTAVSVSMVHPAPVKKTGSDFELLEGISDEINSFTPGLIALKAVNGMLRGDRLIIPGFRNRILFYLNRHAASWIRSAQESLGSNLQPSV